MEEGIVGGGGGEKNHSGYTESTVCESVFGKKKKNTGPGIKRKGENVIGHCATNIGYKIMRNTFTDVNNTGCFCVCVCVYAV